MGNNGLLYEAGCVTSQYDQQLNYKWPFTYDYPPTDNLCNTGTSPTIKFPGNPNIPGHLTRSWMECKKSIGAVQSVHCYPISIEKLELINSNDCRPKLSKSGVLVDIPVLFPEVWVRLGLQCALLVILDS